MRSNDKREEESDYAVVIVSRTKVFAPVSPLTVGDYRWILILQKPTLDAHYYFSFINYVFSRLLVEEFPHVFRIVNYETHNDLAEWFRLASKESNSVSIHCSKSELGELKDLKEVLAELSSDSTMRIEFLDEPLWGFQDSFELDPKVILSRYEKMISEIRRRIHYCKR